LAINSAVEGFTGEEAAPGPSASAVSRRDVPDLPVPVTDWSVVMARSCVVAGMVVEKTEDAVLVVASSIFEKTEAPVEAVCWVTICCAWLAVLLSADVKVGTIRASYVMTIGFICLLLKVKMGHWGSTWYNR